jgi:O-antigen/teichoic acid export membrane protein
MYLRLKKLFGESSVYTIGNMLQRSFSIITMPVFTRCMPVSEYGILAIVRTIRDLFSVLYEVGTSQSSTRFYYDCKDEKEQKRLFSTLLFFTTGFGLVLSIFLMTLGESLWNLVVKEIPFYPYALITIFTVLMGTVGTLPRTLFRVKGQAKLFVKINFFQTLSIVASSIFTVLVLGMGALGPILSVLAVFIAFVFVYLYYLKGYISASFSWETAKKCLSFGLPDMPVRFGNWGLKMANQLILQFYVPLAMVAVYSVGYSVGSILFEMIISGVHWAVQPFYYQTAIEESQERAREIFAYVAVYNATLILFLALFTILFGRNLLTVFASSKYALAEPIIVLIAIASVFQFLFFIPSQSLYLMKKTMYLPPLLFVTVGVNVIVSFLLIPRYGIMGAAWATLIAYFARGALALILTQRIFYVPYDYWRIGKAAVAFGIIIFTKSYLPEWNRFTMFVMNTALLFAYPVLLYFLGFFEKRELSRLRMEVSSMLQKSVLKVGEANKIV